METKLFELRDRATFIPLLCIKPGSGGGTPFEAKMAWRFGYKGSDAVIVTNMSVPSYGCEVDPFAWRERTLQVAHRYIQERWDTLKSGDLIDVEFILGEKPAPSPSEA